MPPLINRNPHRYHPFSRPLALQCSFPVERHACPPHSLYTIYPTDPDVTDKVDLPVVTLAQQKADDLEAFYKKLEIVLTDLHVPSQHELAKEDLPVGTLTQQKADDLEAFYKKLEIIFGDPNCCASSPSQHEKTMSSSTSSTS